MTDREAFIEAIAARRDDGTVRLAFADWLQEHGEEDRAEFVRLSHALAACSREAELPRLRKQVLNLLETHGPRWFDPFCRALGQESVFGRRGRRSAQAYWTGRLRLDDPRYQRDFDSGQIDLNELSAGVFSGIKLRHGFVQQATVLLASESPVGDIAGVFRCEPVEELTIRTAAAPDQWRRLNVPSLARIQKLAVEAPPEPTPQAIEVFDEVLAGEHWSGVYDFYLACSDADLELQGGYAARLLRAPLLSGLKTLWLRDTQHDLIPLVCSPLLTSLRCFFALGCEPADAVFRALRDASFRPSADMLILSLTCHRIDESVEALTSAPWPKLRMLALEGVTDASVRHLLPLVPQLTYLYLRGKMMTDAGAAALVAAVNPEYLQTLDLSSNPLSESMVAALRARFGSRFKFTPA
ncbi:TIGR02996 domain-containing protein [Gemmata sp. JC717]|uniref:TIGR02996 domain-containing protein n=1 Tax=Gemmata algarum TaxID=2975278 RepID=UPI0021BAEBF8|nr:TIGR02996 domain-containing protein [Gemmata algarum]MDY3557014.1 TIGR02996 domain-containing protein [Gemmata algarum]